MTTVEKNCQDHVKKIAEALEAYGNNDMDDIAAWNTMETILDRRQPKVDQKMVHHFEDLKGQMQSTYRREVGDEALIDFAIHETVLVKQITREANQVSKRNSLKELLM